MSWSMTAFFAGVVWSMALAHAGTLSVRVVDEHDAPTAARVYLLDAEGVLHKPGDAIVYEKTRPGASERHFVPPGGKFQLDLPAGTYRLTIERGKEVEPVEQQIDVPAEGSVDRVIHCKRWIDMAARGWYSGDMHVHRPLRQLSTLMESEDLNIAVPLTRWRTNRDIKEDPDLAEFAGKADEAGFIRFGKFRFATAIAEELEPNNSALLVSQLGRERTAMSYPLEAYGRLARKHGAFVDVEKATSLEMPVITALGAADGIGLANNHFWRTGGSLSPWGTWPGQLPREYPRTSAAFAQAGFDLYAMLLNMGFRLVPTAGSASGVHPVPPGWSRVYVHVPGDFTPQAWYDALRNGRSFVTTAPMLMLTVNGHEPGDDVRDGAFPLNVDASVEMFSRVAVESAEVVVNGKPHVVTLQPTADRPHVYQGHLPLTLESSSWIAARWIAERLGSCDLAHTAPIYFWKNHEPIPVPRHEAEYFLGRVDRMIEEVETGNAEMKGERTSPPNPRPTTIVITPEEVKSETLKIFREAREVYRKKVDGAN